MGGKRTEQRRWHAPGARFGASFWDGVEAEIEATDAADLALFLEADRLPCKPRPGFEAALGRTLAARVRSRFSN